MVNVFRSTACGASWEINVRRSRVYQDFEEACSLLGKAGAIQCCQEEISVTDAGQQTMTFLKTLLQPFMDSYQVTCRHIVPIDWLTDWSMTAFYRLLFLNSKRLL